MTHATDETNLLRASLSGDRDAFGRIVEQYQGLVCGISYSATGNLAVSEEIAQESFLRAWRNLKQLKDLQKFRSWLLAIVRNQVRDSIAARPAAPQSLDGDNHPTPTADADPSRIAINAEQQAIVWRALESVPQNYREPMVLYYRRGRSVRQVAEDLSLSEDAVKQRLSRGRKLLREEVAGVLEGVLGSTGPGKLFTVAVVASLPAMAPQAASAAAAGMAVKGATAAKTTLAAGITGAVLGPLVGLLGGAFGSWMSIRNTRSPRERAFMIKVTAVIAAEVLVLIALLCILLWLSLKGIVSRKVYLTIFAVLMGGHLVLLVAMIIWGNRRQRLIQQQEGTCTPPQSQPQNISRASVMASFGGSIVGAVAWLIVMAVMAHDWYAAALTAAAAGILMMLSVHRPPTDQAGYWRRALLMLAALLAINLTAVTLRWDHWLTRLAGNPNIKQVENLSAAGMDLLITLLFALLAVVFLMRARSRRSQSAVEDRS